MSSDKPVLPLKEAYRFGAEKGLGEEVQRIRTMEIEWDLPYTSSLRRGEIVYLFNEHGLFAEFKNEFWPYGDSESGKREVASYLRMKSRYEEFLRTGKQHAAEPDDDDESADQSFAAERDLREFLAKNPGCIEKGLRIFEDGGKLGNEFTIDEGRGRIDLLAVDAAGKFVVIELKLGKGRNKTLGQLLYYMGWVDKTHTASAPCRGIIIAKDIPPDLILAAKRVPGVSLFSYNLSVSVVPVTSSA